MLAVKQFCQRYCENSDQQIGQQREAQGGYQCIPAQTPALFFSVFSCIPAHDGLYALADSGVDRYEHQSDICQNAVCRHTCISV